MSTDLDHLQKKTRRIGVNPNFENAGLRVVMVNAFVIWEKRASPRRGLREGVGTLRRRRLQVGKQIILQGQILGSCGLEDCGLRREIREKSLLGAGSEPGS